MATIKKKMTRMSVSSDGSFAYLFDRPDSFQMIDLREKKEIKYFLINPPYKVVKADFLFDGTLFLYVKDDQDAYELLEKSSGGEFEKSSYFNFKVWVYGICTVRNYQIED